MSERDELAGLLFTTDNSKAVSPWSEWEHAKQHPRLSEYVYAMADAILAAGYRRPRTITTTEELDALAQRATILDADDHVWTNDGDTIDQWGSVTSPESYGGPKWVGSADIELPATLIHEGEAS